MDIHYIYKIECLVNGKVYIGQTKNKAKRIQEHKRTLNKNEHYSIYLQRAYNKYGSNNFSFSIIDKCSLNDVDEKECFWIEHYDSTNINKGYNMESGGSRHKRHNELSKAKMSEYALSIGRWQGENNPNYGGHLWDDSRREHYSEWNKIMWTPEKRVEQSRIMKEVYNLDDALEAVRVKVVKLTLDGEYLDTYDSVTEAARSIGPANTGHISSCCKGKRRSAFGHVWVYLDDYETGNYFVKPSPLELNKTMKVVKLTMNNEFVGEYVYGDIKSNNKGKILGCIKGERKSTQGFRWMKQEDYLNMLKES